MALEGGGRLLLAAAVAIGAYFVVTSSDAKEEEGGVPDGGPARLPPPMPAPRYAPPPTPGVPLPPPGVPRVAIPPTPELMQAAMNLYSVVSVPTPCAMTVEATRAFQQRAAAEGRPLSPDGKYGQTTVNVLSSVLAMQGLQAPPALWGSGRRCQGAAVAVARPAPGQAPRRRPGGPAAPPPPPAAPNFAGQLLANQVGLPITAADSYLSRADYEGAVEAYKAAGHAGAMSVGPAIDAQTHGQSAVKTKQAWVLNGEMAKLNSAPFNGIPASAQDAMQAQRFAHTMLALYTEALNAAHAVAGWYTGIGTVIPAWTRAKAVCLDAQADVRLCVSVASALATETDPTRLRSFAATLASTGFPQAANALLSKADSLTPVS